MRIVTNVGAKEYVETIMTSDLGKQVCAILANKPESKYRNLTSEEIQDLFYIVTALSFMDEDIIGDLEKAFENWRRNWEAPHALRTMNRVSEKLKIKELEEELGALKEGRKKDTEMIEKYWKLVRDVEAVNKILSLAVSKPGLSK